MSKPRTPFIVRLHTFLHSKHMRVIDWALAGASLAAGVFLLTTEGPGLNTYIWLAGGTLGLVFAWQRPAQRMTARMVGGFVRAPHAASKMK